MDRDSQCRSKKENLLYEEAITILGWKGAEGCYSVESLFGLWPFKEGACVVSLLRCRWVYLMVFVFPYWKSRWSWRNCNGWELEYRLTRETEIKNMFNGKMKDAPKPDDAWSSYVRKRVNEEGHNDTGKAGSRTTVIKAYKIGAVGAATHPHPIRNWKGGSKLNTAERSPLYIPGPKERMYDD